MDEKIQSQLIKPFVEKMEREWKSLYEKVVAEKCDESDQLRPEVEAHLNKIQSLLNNENPSQNIPLSSDEKVREFLRQAKMDLRTAERRWQRHVVSVERVKTRAANHSAKFPDLKNSD